MPSFSLFKSKTSRNLPSLTTAPQSSFSRTSESERSRTLGYKRPWKRMLRTPSPPPNPLGRENAMLNPYAYACAALLIDAAAVRDAERERTVRGPPEIASAKFKFPSTDSLDSESDYSERSESPPLVLDRDPLLSQTPIRRPLYSVPEVLEGASRKKRATVTRSTSVSSLSARFAHVKDNNAEKSLPSPPPPTPTGSLGRHDVPAEIRLSKYHGPNGFTSLVGLSAAIMAGSVSDSVEGGSEARVQMRGRQAKGYERRTTVQMLTTTGE